MRTPEPVAFEASDGVVVYGDLYSGPSGKAGPLVLAFHQGGGDARGEYGPIAPRLVDAGYSVLAIDQRSGGDRFGGTNRTRATLNSEATMCEAYLDLEAALRFVERSGFTGRRVAWGSSYSAALALRLATEHAQHLNGVIAFSVGSGPPLADCDPTPFIARIGVPLFALRPADEMDVPSVQRQVALLQEHGHRTFVSDPGTHGSSMLVPERIDGDAEPTWTVVLAFLQEVLD